MQTWKEVSRQAEIRKDNTGVVEGLFKELCMERGRQRRDLWGSGKGVDES